MTIRMPFFPEAVSQGRPFATWRHPRLSRTKRPLADGFGDLCNSKIELTEFAYNALVRTGLKEAHALHMRAWRLSSIVVARWIQMPLEPGARPPTDFLFSRSLANCFSLPRSI